MNRTALTGALSCASGLFLLTCLSGPAEGSDWNQWRGPNRNGAATDSPPLIQSLPAEGLQPLWISDEAIPGGGNGGWSSPVVADGKAYLFVHSRSRREGVELPPEEYPPLGDDERASISEEEIARYEEHRRLEQRERTTKLHRFDETLFCFDAETGETLWKDERESAFVRHSQSGTPAVSHGCVYLLGADRRLRCLQADTGEEHWATRLPVEPHDDQVPSSIALAEGAAVVLADSLVAVDAESGELLWQGDPGTTAGRESSPVVWKHGGREWIIAHVNGRETVCVDPRTGEERWRVESQANRSTPVVVQDRLITYGHSRQAGLRCFALSPERADPVWAFRGLADPGSNPVVVDGHVYVQGENRLACIDLETGRPAWRTTLDLPKPRYTSLVAADGKVFYAFAGLLGFRAEPDRYRPLIEAHIDETGLLAPAAHFRRVLNIDELERTPEGQEQAQRLWQQTIGRHGPLDCTSPALADGRLYVRLKGALACYDLRVPQQTSPATQ